MVAHPKGKSLLLFGGFYDTGNEIRYYNDVWELALDTMTWKHRAGGGGGLKNVGPSPRSASHVAAHGDALFVYGGYCKYAGDGDAGSDGEPDDEREHGREHGACRGACGARRRSVETRLERHETFLFREGGFFEAGPKTNVARRRQAERPSLTRLLV